MHPPSPWHTKHQITLQRMKESHILLFHVKIQDAHHVLLAYTKAQAPQAQALLYQALLLQLLRSVTRLVWQEWGEAKVKVVNSCWKPWK